MSTASSSTPVAPDRKKRNWREASLNSTPSPSTYTKPSFNPKELLLEMEGESEEVTMQTLDKKLNAVLFSLDRIDTDLTAQKHQFQKQEEAISKLQMENRTLKRKVTEFEMHSRRNNLKFYGIPDKNKESWKESDEKIIELCRAVNLKYGLRTLERAHRLGSYNANQKFPRPIIAKFYHFKDRDAAWEALNKDPKKRAFVREDFPFEIEQARKTLLPIFHKAKKDPKFNAKLKVDKLIINDGVYTIDDINNLPPCLQPENIFTPTRKDQVSFFTINSPLSNMYPAPFTINGDKFNCAEQYIAVQKSCLFGDAQLTQKILREQNPYEQKRLSKKVQNFDKAQWEAQAPDLILPGIVQKFSENLHCKQFLLNTGSRVIAEASPDDNFWGTGCSLYSADLWDSSKWSGKNMMGKVLSLARKKISSP